MRHGSSLCSELQTIQSAIEMAGTPPKRAEPRTTSQCAETAGDLLEHVATAEQAARASKLRPQLYDEAVFLLASIKAHVCEIVNYANAGTSPESARVPGFPADERLIEQFADLRDKCCYPLMDMVERISAILGGSPVPGDLITPELATKLFCVTRSALSRAVRDGQLKSYRDAHEPQSTRRRFSQAQLARAYERRR